MKRKDKTYHKATKIPDLKSILFETIKKAGFEKKLADADVVNNWSKICGEKIAEISTAQRYANFILYIKINSSAWRNEMFLLQNHFIKLINDYYGREVVKKIIFC